MKRRNFLKGILGLIAAPFVGVVAAKPAASNEIGVDMASGPDVTGYMVARSPGKLRGLTPKVWSPKMREIYSRRATFDQVALRSDEFWGRGVMDNPVVKAAQDERNSWLSSAMDRLDPAIGERIIPADEFMDKATSMLAESDPETWQDYRDRARESQQRADARQEAQDRERRDDQRYRRQQESFDSLVDGVETGRRHGEF